MEKKQIPIIALAVFSILILLAYNVKRVYADTTIYQITTNGSNSIGYSSYETNQCGGNINRLLGEKIAVSSSLIRQSFDRIIFDVKRSYANTNNIAYVGVWSASVTPTNLNYIRLFGTIDTSTLALGSFTTVGFDFTSYNITSGVIIGVFYQCDTGFDFLELRTSSTNQFDGSNTFMGSWRPTGGFIDNTANDVGFIMIVKDQGEKIPPFTISGVDCNLPENQFKLICRLGQTGSISGSAGAFVIGNTTSQTGLLGLGCGIGIVDCIADSNPQTNGLGLLIFIMSLFVIIGMFYHTIGKEAFHMPIFIWIVIIMALSAFFTITGLIDPVFLVLSVIAIIALAVPKIMTIVRGNSSFGGGSTE